MALPVEITGGANIDQGAQIALTAVVGDTPGTLQYAWSASRGTFIGAIDAASVVYHANFTDTDDVDVTITCDVTRPADTNPTVTTGSLTAMRELGITGQVLNMFLNPTADTIDNQRTDIYSIATSAGTLAAGSDDDLASNIQVNEIEWLLPQNKIILRRNGSGSYSSFWSSNTGKRLFLIFNDGTVWQAPPPEATGLAWSRIDVSDTSIQQKMLALDGSANSTLLVGVGDADSIGFDEQTGSDTETFTAAAVKPLLIEAIDEQFITIGTEDYDLVIDITGNPDTVEATGHMEGFSQDWDAAQHQLHIRAADVTRLINGVLWNIEAIKSTETLTSEIKYNVIPAAPILETLPTLHLYKGVPINFDVVIANIPPLLIPNSRLLGIKSELVEHGLNFRGLIPADANLTLNSGNVTIIIPSDTGETSDMHDYPYLIEAGSPPPIETPKFSPYGPFGQITFDDLNHALGYEWTLQEGDDAAWNFFNETRPLINPSEVEMTPGHLNVTISFPNIATASSYEYQLVSETGETQWIGFTGTLSNNMITTIIPDLQDGVQYTLRLRVASPWVGTPISITVYGGRLVYCIQDESTGDDSLYIFHTGVANGTTANRIKRVLLPTALTRPQGLAVDADGNVYILNLVLGNTGERALYVFNADTIDNLNDGGRLSTSRKNPLTISTNAGAVGMAIYGNELYIVISNVGGSTGFRNGLNVASTSVANGQALTLIRHSTLADIPTRGISISEDSLLGVSGAGSNRAFLNTYDRNSGEANTPRSSHILLNNRAANNIPANQIHGLKSIDDYVYILFASAQDFEMKRLKSNPSTGRYQEDWFVRLPAGLRLPRKLDMTG